MPVINLVNGDMVAAKGEIIMLKLISALSCALLLAACATVPEPEVPPADAVVPEATESFSAENEALCQAAGGSYGPAGMMGWYRCTMPYADGGDVCSDSPECEGQCRASMDDQPSMEGEPVTGTCQMNDNRFGCYGTVEDGRVGGFLCVD